MTIIVAPMEFEMTEEEKLEQIKELVSNIDLFINKTYKFSFAYPVDIPEAIVQLQDHLFKTSEQSDDLTDAMGSLVQAVAIRIKDMTLAEIDEDTKHRIVFLLCGFILQLSEVHEDQKMIGGNTYRLNIHLDENDGMTVEMCDVVSTH